MQDAWRDEANRCWGRADAEQPAGWLGDFVPPGEEYSTLIRMYMATDTKPLPQDDRPWNRLEGAAEEPEEEELADEGDKEFDAAIEFFFGSSDSADGEAAGAVLDVGCGDGYMGRRFAQSGRFASVFAFDVDWQPLELARSAAEEARIAPEDGLMLFRADGQKLPFKEAVVDFAWWGMGLHFVEDVTVALSEVARSLKPGGKLVATTIPGMKTGNEPEDLKQKAEAAGFSKVDVEERRGNEFILKAVK
eukprot:TRINITY_DN35715_c0_g1_i2.p1 TRINITY_DN35715_c0_g1~~TRINITY_DN35715_c0_g1_i2.p1  ORF type:complete len:248 (+),score=83.81 TRINITY_DN35715_c0_g1_i2:267-1010(+)